MILKKLIVPFINLSSVQYIFSVSDYEKIPEEYHENIENSAFINELLD